MIKRYDYSQYSSQLNFVNEGFVNIPQSDYDENGFAITYESINVDGDTIKICHLIDKNGKDVLANTRDASEKLYLVKVSRYKLRWFDELPSCEAEYKEKLHTAKHKIIYIVHWQELGFITTQIANAIDVYDSDGSLIVKNICAVCWYTNDINIDGRDWLQDDGSNAYLKIYIDNYDKVNFINKDGIVFGNKKKGVDSLPYVKDVFTGYGYELVKTLDGKYSFVSDLTGSIVVLPGGKYEFDNVKPFPFFYCTKTYIKNFNEISPINFVDSDYIVVQSGDKVNVIFCGFFIYSYSYPHEYSNPIVNVDGDFIPYNVKHFHYILDNWVDDLKHIGQFPVYLRNGKMFILWYNNEYPFENIYKGIHDTVILKNKGKWSILKNGVIDEFPDKFDNMYDYGSDDFDADYDDDFFPYPIVEKDGKYTYIDLYNFRYLFMESSDGTHFGKYGDHLMAEYPVWFDDVEPCYKVKDAWIFPVKKDGHNFFLDEGGNIVDKNGELEF